MCREYGRRYGGIFDAKMLFDGDFKTFKIHMDHYPEDPFISITYFHSQTLAEELKRNADSLIPRWVLCCYNS